MAFICDDHDKEIPGAIATPWLFYSGVDGCPGRYFEVQCQGGWWESPGGEKYPTSESTSDVWHESLGLNAPKVQY